MGKLRPGNTHKDVENLTDDDFFRHYPLRDGMEQRDIFYQNFSALFKRYKVKHFENEINKYLRHKHGNGEFLSDEEFSKVHGEPPWILANKIIEEACLDYQFNSPENQGPDEPFELKLINNLNGAAVNFSDLSSGELASNQRPLGPESRGLLLHQVQFAPNCLHLLQAAANGECIK